MGEMVLNHHEDLTRNNLAGQENLIYLNYFGILRRSKVKILYMAPFLPFAPRLPVFKISFSGRWPFYEKHNV
jgi:hypothetical protein